MAGRRSVAEARDTREAIVRHATDLASVEGLEGITIGRLAAELGMSKAGVIGQFGSKEDLQLAALEHATEVFTEVIWRPVEHLEPGLPRLLGVLRTWTDYERDPPFRGGCFIAKVSFEFNTREGRVHDELAKVARRWRKTLVRDVEIAVEAGDLPADTDPEQVAFSIEALAAAAGPARALQGNKQVAEWSLRAMYAVLGLSPERVR